MINYILQVVLFQVLFLAVYDFFLQKETFFKWNRLYLLLTPVLAFIIPFLKFESLQKSIPNIYVDQLPTVFLNPQAVIFQTVEIESSINYLQIGFYSGIVLFSVLFLIKLFKIIQLIATNEVVKSKNFKLVLLNRMESAFSFFNYIFIKRDFVKNKELSIIQHEMVHCKQLHTLDLLFFELLKIAMWFNPLIYLYQNRITLLHEYISDAEVVQQTDKSNYFNTILAETFNVENISFINQFYKQSLIKKRIVMIAKEKSQKMKQLKYLLMIPLIGGMLVLSSFEGKSNKELTSSAEEILNENSLLDPINATFKLLDTTDLGKDVAFAQIEKVPVFSGCEGSEDELRVCLQEKITEHINKNFNSNLATELNLKAGIEKIYVMFKIDKNGEIANVMARASHKLLEEEAIRVVSSIPKMKPGKQKGEDVNVKYSLPIVFKIDDKTTSITDLPILKEYEKGQDVPFAIIDEVPIFPGCEGDKKQLKSCLQESITAFVSANFNAKLVDGLGLEPGVKKIFVMFKIDKEGKITDVDARGPHQSLADEAMRVINLLPKMIPGKHKGENVGVKYSLPIAFKVE